MQSLAAPVKTPRHPENARKVAKNALDGTIAATVGAMEAGKADQVLGAKFYGDPATLSPATPSRPENARKVAKNALTRVNAATASAMEAGKADHQEKEGAKLSILGCIRLHKAF